MQQQIRKIYSQPYVTSMSRVQSWKTVKRGGFALFICCVLFVLCISIVPASTPALSNALAMWVGVFAILGALISLMYLVNGLLGLFRKVYVGIGMQVVHLVISGVIYVLVKIGVSNVLVLVFAIVLTFLALSLPGGVLMCVGIGDMRKTRDMP